MSLTTRVGMALPLAAALAALPASAHHSFAMFDNTRSVTLHGKVTAYQWTNPHSYLDIDADDGKGGTKHYTMDLHGQMVDMVQDIAGRLIVGCPSFADLENPEIAAQLSEAFAAEGDYTAEQVLRVFHYLRDTTADLFGGWISVTEQLAGAGAYAQRLVTLRNFDLADAKTRAKRALGIEGGPAHGEQR